MTIDVHVTRENDVSLGVLTHKGLNPAMGFPTPAPTLSIETVVNTKHLPGYVLNKNKLTRTVLLAEWWGGDGTRLMLDGHDHGPFIQDLTPAPIVNLWYAVMWPFSSRKCAFSAAKVWADDGPFGGAQVHPWVLPWITCGEPFSLPMAWSPTTFRNNVIVGFERADIAAGAASALAAILIDFLFEKLGPQGAPGTPQQELLKELAARLLGFSGRAGAAKLAIASIVDGAISYARGRAMGTGDWSIKVGVGSPYLGLEGSYTGSRTPGASGGSLQRTVGPHQRSHALNGRKTTTQVAGGAPTTVPWDPPATPGGRNGGGAR